jgi:hypothetical protein
MNFIPSTINNKRTTIAQLQPLGSNLQGHGLNSLMIHAFVIIMKCLLV